MNKAASVGPKGAGRKARDRFGGRSGAVTLEYVILAVLIAAAVVLAVVVFSRSIATMFIAAGEGTTLQHTKAQKDLEMRKADRVKDGQVARDYHDAFHE